VAEHVRTRVKRFYIKTTTGQSGGETGLMVVLINSTLREQMAEKNGAHKTIYSVLPNEKYAVRVRVLVCNSCALEKRGPPPPLSIASYHNLVFLQTHTLYHSNF
jgi:hypothetical protein